MGFLYWLVAGLYCNAVLAQVIYYDANSGAVITEAQKASRDAQGNTFWCVNAFEKCSATEGRRFDGSCNNLNNPAAGAGHSKFERLLPAYYSEVNRQSPYFAAVNGDGPQRSPRDIRTAVVPDGFATGGELSQFSILFLAVVSLDFTTSTAPDVNFNLGNITTCCSAAGAANPNCAPIAIPKDDPLSLVAGITCLNLTKPIDFLSQGCSSIPFERIQYGAANLDLKFVYGVDPQTSLVRQRLFKGGLFNYSTAVDGLQWPELTPITPADGMQIGTGHLFVISLLFWREHNRIATELAKLNPSWDDAKLFEIAREINIAQYTQVVYYESLPYLFGYENLVRDGVLFPSGGFRDIYDVKVLPGWWTESLYTVRWFHSVVNSNFERYTLDGEFIDQVKVSLTFAPSELNMGNNLTSLTQGLIRGQNAKADDRLDGFMGETALGVVPNQQAFDLASIDLMRGRTLGVPPYTKILNFCDGESYDDFESLEDHLDEDAIETFMELYETSGDIELLPALWREKYYPGAKVPKTFYCLFVKQLQRNVQSDRHWYERPNRPNALTAAQLAEVRKSSMARLLCDNMAGFSKTGLSAKPLEPISDENPIVSCDTIPTVNLNAWKQAEAVTPVTPATPTATKKGVLPAVTGAGSKLKLKLRRT